MVGQGDKKYLAVKEDGTKYLLRITPMERYEARKGAVHNAGTA